MHPQTPLEQRPGYSSPRRQGFAPGAQFRPRGLFLGSRRVHGHIVRGGTEITLPQIVGANPLQTWLGQSTAWEGIQ